MSFLSEQLPLAVQLRDDATFDNFYLGDNQLLMNQLRAQLDDGERYIYLYGEAACGRSHLLQAACHYADQQGVSSLYLPLLELLEYKPAELFEGLEQLQLLCLDDVHQVLGRNDWEEQLFHLFNRLKDYNVALIVSADSAVRELSCVLADLRSRLSWGSVYHVQALDDQQKKQAFQFRASRRGLEVGDEVAQFIYHRCQRNTQALLDVLDKLDRASLKEQRRLTIPFVKRVLAW